MCTISAQRCLKEKQDTHSIQTQKYSMIQFSKELWITQGPPPQFVVLDLTKLQHCPEAFNLFGLYCWHDYPTNPSLVELLMSQDAKRYNSIGKYPVERAQGWQYFKLANIPFSKARYLQIMVSSNHGGDKTYINKIMIGFENQEEAPPGKIQ